MEKFVREIDHNSDLMQISLIIWYVLRMIYIKGFLTLKQYELLSKVYSEEELAESFSSAMNYEVIAEPKGYPPSVPKVSGIITLDLESHLDDQPMAELKNLFVALECLSEGIGTLLLQTALAAARKQELTEVFTYALSFCVEFYVRFGFVDHGVRQVMVKDSRSDSLVPFEFHLMTLVL